MVSEFIQNRIDTAHDMIDQGYYEQAVELLKNLKNRTHETGTYQEIKQWELEHDKKLNELLDNIDHSSDDPLRKQKNKEKKWKEYTQTYLNYYHKLSIENDI